MKPIKFIVLAAAAIAFLGVFALPYIKAGDTSFTLWKLRNINPRESLAHPYIILIMSLPALILGGMAVASQKLARWATIVTLVTFAIGAFIGLAVFTKTHTKFGHDGAIGAKLMVLAMIAGAGASLVNIIKPDTDA
jgi:cyanate permease